MHPILGSLLALLLPNKKPNLTVAFNRATVYGASRIETYPGELFALDLINYPGQVKWFADNDAVLDIVISPNSHQGKITPLTPGNSTILIKGHNLSMEVHIHILKEKAATLDIVVGEPEYK